MCHLFGTGSQPSSQFKEWRQELSTPLRVFMGASTGGLLLRHNCHTFTSPLIHLERVLTQTPLRSRQQLRPLPSFNLLPSFFQLRKTEFSLNLTCLELYYLFFFSIESFCIFIHKYLSTKYDVKIT